MKTTDQQVAELTQHIQRLMHQVSELNNRVHFLERENTRNKNNIQQLAHKKG